MFTFDVFGEGSCLGATTFAQQCRFGECPLQMRVADLVAAATVALAGRRVLAADQAGVREELSDAAKATDVTDLVHEDHRQCRADAWNAAQPIIGLRVVDPGVLLQVSFELSDQLIVVVDRLQVDAC